MAEGGKDRTALYVVLALVVLWFISQETKQLRSATKTLSTTGAQNVGYGLGKGLVDSGSSAIGKFVSGFFSPSHSSSSGSFSSSGVGAGNPNFDEIASSSGVESYDEQPDVVGISGVDYDVGV